MKIFFTPDNRRFFAVGMLSIFLFVFLHSELDQFSHQEDDHASHDFCQLVDAASTRVHSVQSTTIVKQSDTIDSGTLCNYLFSHQQQSYWRLKNPPPGRLYASVDLFLQNASFLI